jgi:hypothetical protein
MAKEKFKEYAEKVMDSTLLFLSVPGSIVQRIYCGSQNWKTIDIILLKIRKSLVV